MQQMHFNSSTMAVHTFLVVASLTACALAQPKAKQAPLYGISADGETAQLVEVVPAPSHASRLP
jgi:hypothetical protein